MSAFNLIPGWMQDYLRLTYGGIPLQAATVAAVTDNSGGTGAAGGTIATLAATVTIPITLPRILLTSTDTPADLVTDYIPGVVGDIVRWGFVTEVVATSGGTADVDLDLQIAATPVTGAKFTALTQADFAAIGQVKQSAALSAANTLAADSTLSIVCTESTTNFTAGAIVPIIWVALTQANLKNAIAVLAAQLNEIRSVLRTAKLMA
jgi:hypothetical protein